MCDDSEGDFGNDRRKQVEVNDLADNRYVRADGYPMLALLVRVQGYNAKRYKLMIGRQLFGYRSPLMWHFTIFQRNIHRCHVDTSIATKLLLCSSSKAL